MSSGMLYGKEEQEQFRHFTASETVTNKERGSRRCEHKGAEYENYCNQVRQGFLMFMCGREEARSLHSKWAWRYHTEFHSGLSLLSFNNLYGTELSRWTGWPRS